MIGFCFWGYSSAGRALEWHSRGQRFDPAYLHQEKSRKSLQCKAFGIFIFFTEIKKNTETSVLLQSHLQSLLFEF